MYIGDVVFYKKGNHFFTMKKLLLISMVAIIMLFQFCTPKAAQMAIPKAYYQNDVANIVATSCAPCHIPPKGFKKPYTSFDAVKGDINEIIRRVQLNPGEQGFMPYKAAAKLPDSLINILLKWKADGLLEHK
jgi:hypothetical protein